MKILDIGTVEPSLKHVRMALRHGTSDLHTMPPESFYEGAPQPYGMVRAEDGCLIKSNQCVQPHTDCWLALSSVMGPAKQRSLFWVLSGKVFFKVDGFAAVEVGAGDYVVFDHRKEHMVLANKRWLAAAWQLRPAREKS